jgi:3-dehydroquinate synthase
MSSIPWSISEDSYDVSFTVPQVLRLRFTRDCFGADWERIATWFAGDDGPARVQVWVDRAVAAADPRLLRNIAARLAEHGPQLELVAPVECLDGGEQAKNDERTVNHVLRSIERDGLDRRSYVLVVGGGALLDAVGYAAAIAHRGIRLVRFPTTTLAQADSGVGVKNAINAFGKKNWKGTFAVPWGVVNDQGLIAHLPDRDFRAGFSEAVKVSLLKSPAAFGFLCRHAADIARRDWTAVMPAIRSSVLMHLHHITHGGDAFEMQAARPLDFGHWSAHKLEQLTGYELRHGEAVAIGVALDTLYSHLRLGLDRTDALQALRALHDLGLPVHHPLLEGEGIFAGLEEFRQHLGGRLTLTMLRGVGVPVSVHEVDKAAMVEAIGMLRAIDAEWRARAAVAGVSDAD